MNRITNITNQMRIGYLALSLRKILAAVIMSCFSLTYIGAQDADTEFWLVLPTVTYDNSANFPYPSPTRLYITNNTNQVASVEITAYNGSFTSKNFTIDAGNTTRGDFNPLAASFMVPVTNPNTLFSGNGSLHITSDVPVSAFFEIDQNDYGDIYTLKGRKALGTLFYVPMLNDAYVKSTLATARNNVTIIATEDDTHVTITRRDGGQNTNNMTMNRCQTYMIKDVDPDNPPSLAGTKIESDKPIAVTVTEDGLDADASGDQIVPVGGLGRTYIVPRGIGTSNGNRIYIFATQPGTSVKIQPINASGVAGSVTDMPLNNPGDGGVWYGFGSTYEFAYIEATAPVYVYHRGGDRLGASLVTTAYSTAQTRMTFHQKSNSHATTQRLAFFFRDGAEDDFYIKYGPVGSLDATVGFGAGTRYDFGSIAETNMTGITPITIPSVTGWKFGTFTIANAVSNNLGRQVAIRNDKSPFMVSYFAASSTTGRYGFFSNYGPFSLPDTTYLCGSFVTLYGGFADEYVWTLPDGSTVSGVTSIDATEEGEYTLEMTQNGVLFPSSSETVYATTYVKKVNAGVISPSVILMCAATDNPGTLTVTGVVAPNGTTYQWQRSTDRETWTNIGTGATLSANSYKPTASIRTYYYRRGMTSPECGMAYTDPIMITLDASGGTASPFSQTVCDGTPATTLKLTGATDPAGTTYQWQSSPDASTWANIPSATSATHTPVKPANALYSRTVFYQCVVTTACGTANSTTVSVNFSPCMIPVNPHLMSKIIVQ
jgi:hypothetical protein